MPYPFTPSIIGVIVGRDLIGDALIKLPFLRALRRAFPKAEIHWITSQGPTAYGSQLRPATKELIDMVEETPVWLGLTRESKPPFFDLLIDTRNRWKLAQQAKQIPHGLFLAPAMRFLFSERRPGIFQRRPPHLADRLLQLVELAAGYLPPATGTLPADPGLLQKARTLLPAGRIYVGFAPGAGNHIKIWPRYKFEKAARSQVAKGRVPVFILGPQDLAFYDSLFTTVPEAKFPLQNTAGWETPVMTIDHTLAIGSLLDVAAANDSGVGHMLAAVDCPLVSLFGPTSPRKLAPRVSHGLVIRAQDFGGHSMSAIRWEAVDAAIDELLTVTN